MSDLKKIALDLGSYIVSTRPQLEDGLLRYYISGSLAAMILTNAKSISKIEFDESKNIIGEKNLKEISKEQQEKISKFTRKMGHDVDIVDVNGGMYAGSMTAKEEAMERSKLNAYNTNKNVANFSELVSSIYSFSIDELSEERIITKYQVVRASTPNGDFYVTAPPELIAHKLSETIFCISKIEKSTDSPNIIEINKSKYEKDIKDLSSMFYGFKDLYDKDEFLTRVYTELEEKKGTSALFSTSKYNSENKNQEDLTKIMERIMADCGLYLDEIADNQSSIEIKEFLTDLINRRKAEVEKQKNTEKTPLQQKEKELSSLEEEAKKISEVEALIGKQKEGKDIGD